MFTPYQLQSKKGQTFVEYIVLLSLVALVALKVGSFIKEAFHDATPILKQERLEQQFKTGGGF